VIRLREGGGRLPSHVTRYGCLGVLISMSMGSGVIAKRATEGPWDSLEPWRALFAELSGGNRDALGRLYDMASTRLYRLALWRTGNSDDASEVVQEVFIRLARDREQLGHIADPRWWLLAVTHRIAVDLTRRRSRRRDNATGDFRAFAAPAADPGRMIDADRAWELIRRLSPRQREVIFLHHFAELSFKEIGRCLGIPAFTAASRHRLAIAALRRLLGGTR
jgi:RNA polymerase sigma-70 factor (ECF subfamily)